jgi:GTP-binding protein
LRFCGTRTHEIRRRSHHRSDAGNGGDGIASFRREKFIPRGGPDGGDGGRGRQHLGDGGPQLNTLIDFRFARIFALAKARRGAVRIATAQGGDDITLRMPVGTVITIETGEIIADLARDGAKALIAKGGQGGLGNLHFKSSTNRAPRQCTPGEPGERHAVAARIESTGRRGPPRHAERRQVDVHSLCLGGASQGGRLSFHDAASQSRRSARRRRAQLRHRRHSRADRGPAEGAGLGHQFLRHLARTACCCISSTSRPTDPCRRSAQEAHAIVGELRKYDESLFEKPRWLVINKIDLLPDDERADRIASFLKDYGPVERHFAISAIKGEGCRDLTFAIMEHVERVRAAAADVPEDTEVHENPDS